jgi:peptide/nickel transport system substrate-binding protein
VDELTKKIQSETDKAKRDAMIKEAFELHSADIGHLPLHQQALAWGLQQEGRAGAAGRQLHAFKWISIKK